MNSETHYETLDPEDWDKMRALSHRIVDDAITDDYLYKVLRNSRYLKAESWKTL
jgi:hypothetical protein